MASFRLSFCGDEVAAGCDKGWICVHERSREGGESCSVDGCWSSEGGITGAGGGGRADFVSSIMAEYFVDLKRMRILLILMSVQIVTKIIYSMCMHLSLLQQRHGGTLWPSSLLEELVDGLGLREMVGQAKCGLYADRRTC